MSYEICFNLDLSKILSSGNGLKIVLDSLTLRDSEIAYQSPNSGHLERCLFTKYK